MELSDLHILPTNTRPEFLFYPSGLINIRGRALLVNKDEATDQICNWIDDYINNPAEITYVTLEFEYLNSFSTIILVNILKKLSGGILQSEKLIIKWYYEEDDDDIKERGLAISSIISCPIEFILIKNIASP
jgi:hypothetical protein